MAGTRTLDGLLFGSFIFSILIKDGSLFNSEYEKYLWSFPGGSDSKQSACNARDLGSIPELVRSPEGGNGYSLQYSCLENLMNRGAWQATVHGIAELDMTE